MMGSADSSRTHHAPASLRLDVQALDQVDPDRAFLAEDLPEIAAIARAFVDAEGIEDLLAALGLASFDHEVRELLDDLVRHGAGPDQPNETPHPEGLLGEPLLVEGRHIRH